MNYEEWYQTVRETKVKGRRQKMEVTDIMKQAVEVNKDAVKQASIIKVGKTANVAITAALSEKLLPKKYKKLAENEFFGLAVSNIAALAMKQLSRENDKVIAVADAMILSSVIDITNIVDFNQIISDTMKKIDFSALGFGKNSNK